MILISWGPTLRLTRYAIWVYRNLEVCVFELWLFLYMKTISPGLTWIYDVKMPPNSNPVFLLMESSKLKILHNSKLQICPHCMQWATMLSQHSLSHTHTHPHTNRNSYSTLKYIPQLLVYSNFLQRQQPVIQQTAHEMYPWKINLFHKKHLHTQSCTTALLTDA